MSVAGDRTLLHAHAHHRAVLRVCWIRRGGRWRSRVEQHRVAPPTPVVVAVVRVRRLHFHGNGLASHSHSWKHSSWRITIYCYFIFSVYFALPELTNKFKKIFTFKNTLNYNIGIFIAMLESSHGWNTQLIKAVKDNNTLKTRVLITQNWNNK